MFDGVLSESLLGKARQNKIVDMRVHNIRDYTTDKHRIVDDRPYGGGPGMVMKPEPIHRALISLGVSKKRKGGSPFVIYLSPQGKPLTQELAGVLARKNRLVLLCGHYEGIDERLFAWINMEISVGDVVYTGGEIPAMAVVDAVTRIQPGVVKTRDSLKWDSFGGGWKGRLDCPHYTRPALWRGRQVPNILLGGHHKAITNWREKQVMKSTRRKRPELAESA